jgi:histidyl-tRNA synthetase
MPTYHRPRGTMDILPDDAVRWRALEALIARHGGSFGFGEIRTPIFEESDLYSRTSGASSDIVRKEMYSLVDRGGRSLTLRPEGTAGAARAYVENGFSSQPQPVKLWYLGPMFRYDRPQAGRYRQHTQFGLEIFGSLSPLADVEVILVAHDLFARLGLGSLTCHLNSIGCRTCRPAYHEMLVGYFSGRVERMCEDCRERYARNPLRIFDCKNAACRGLLDEAPVSAENLCPDCGRHLGRVTEVLEALSISYRPAPRLVRGLDYYTRTVFEISSESTPGESGAQHVLCGGGRYDGLIEEVGGQPTPGVGFGMGIERLLSTLEATGKGGLGEGAGKGVPAEMTGVVSGDTVFLGATSPTAEIEALRLARSLRAAGFVAVNDLLGRSVKAQFKAADRLGARFMVLIGEEELTAGQAVVRDMATGEQKRVALGEVREVLGS